MFPNSVLPVRIGLIIVFFFFFFYVKGFGNSKTTKLIENSFTPISEWYNNTEDILVFFRTRPDIIKNEPCSPDPESRAAQWDIYWPHSPLKAEMPPCYASGAVHEIVVTALDSKGNPLCRGGDFFEAIVFGPNFRTRLVLQDRNNGDYVLLLSLPIDKATWGFINLTIALEHENFSGLAPVPRWPPIGDPPRTMQYPVTSMLIRAAPLDICLASLSAVSKGFGIPGTPPTDNSCRFVDFTAASSWGGHWVFLPEGKCLTGVCTGDASVLNSPWVYRLGGLIRDERESDGDKSFPIPSCHFHIFSPIEARSCLNNSWMYFSGDSTFRDSLWNLMVHVLKLNMSHWFSIDNGPDTRSFDSLWADWPADSVSSSFRFRASNVFNGHFNEYLDGLGLATLDDFEWKKKQENLIEGDGNEASPDIFFVTSGPHDAIRMSMSGIAGMAEHASFIKKGIDWWQKLSCISSDVCKRTRPPRFIWRTSPTPSLGYWKTLNAQHLELLNIISTSMLREKKSDSCDYTHKANNSQKCNLQQHSLNISLPNKMWSFLDFFDLTFSWHLKEPNTHPDFGVHYGLAKNRCYILGEPFFPECNYVDIMGLHVLLNSVCPLKLT